jgi:phospholipid/cholesterol/gamma-HCH transport system permease protein
MALCAWGIGAALRPKKRGPFDGAELWRATYGFGNRSLPLTLITSVFMGMMLVLQSAQYVRQYGAHELVGYFTGFAVLRELGPVVLGLMLSGRVGANNTAELATLRATERLDALQTLQVDLSRWLLLPRTLAMMLAQLSLLMFFNLTSLLAGAAAARFLLGISWGVFFRSATERLTCMDLLAGSAKALIFGYVVAVISCYFGCAHRGGPTQVGVAVRQQVVASAVCLFAIDYLLSVSLQGAG